MLFNPQKSIREFQLLRMICFSNEKETREEEDGCIMPEASDTWMHFSRAYFRMRQAVKSTSGWSGTKKIYGAIIGVKDAKKGQILTEKPRYSDFGQISS